MILYHGTSTSRAKSITENGFRKPDLTTELTSIAESFGIPSSVLIEKLTSLGRFVIFRNTDAPIYFSSHFNHAASYATRGPEFFWESLWAIYGLQHPEIDFNWNQSDEGHAWVLGQMQHDPPVVLHVEIPDELLGAELEKIFSLRSRMPPDSENGGREIGLELSEQFCIVNRTDIDFRVNGSLLRFLSELSPEEIALQVDAGAWGTPLSYRAEKYWNWQDIKRRLTESRLNELGL